MSKPTIYKGDAFVLRTTASTSGADGTPVPYDLSGYFITMGVGTTTQYIGNSQGLNFKLSVTGSVITAVIPSDLSARMAPGKLNVVVSFRHADGTTFSARYSPCDIIEPLSDQKRLPCVDHTVVFEQPTFVTELHVGKKEVGQVSITTVKILKDGQLDIILDNGQILRPGTIRGGDGSSAYEMAVAEGFVGTKEEWLKSLQGEAVPALEWRTVVDRSDRSKHHLEVRPLCSAQDPRLGSMKVGILRWKRQLRMAKNGSTRAVIAKFNVMDDSNGPSPDEHVTWTKVRIQPVPFDSAVAAANNGWFRLPYTVEDIFARRVEIREEAGYLNDQLAVIHRGGWRGSVKAYDGIDSDTGTVMSLGSFISGVRMIDPSGDRGRDCLFRISRKYDRQNGYRITVEPIGMKHRKRYFI